MRALPAAVLSELRCQIHRLEKARGGCNALSGNIKGCSMVDGCPYDRQPQRDVHSTFEIEQFQRNVTLIVIHADDRVVPVLPDSEVKNGIGCNRPFNWYSLRARPFDCWPDLLLLFIAK